MCGQVVALLSAEHSASLVWDEEDSNTGSVVSRPGFQVFLSFIERHLKSNSDLLKMNLRHIPRYMAPPCCSVDASTFVPRLLLGETAQGFWTVTYVHQYIKRRSLDPSPHTVLSLNHLLWVLGLYVGHNVHPILETRTIYSYLRNLMRTQFRSSSMWLSRIFSQSNVMTGMLQ